MYIVNCLLHVQEVLTHFGWYKLLYKMGQDFLNIHSMYVLSVQEVLTDFLWYKLLYKMDQEFSMYVLSVKEVMAPF